MNATISDLIMGNSYKFRIYSENKCGKSEDATVTKDAAKILKTGETLVRGGGSQSLQPEPGKQDENTKNITKNVTKEGKGAKNKKTPSIDYNPPIYQEHDFSEAPKFTTNMPDRSTTVGYTAKLLCSVRGCPKPQIIWMKNQMIIGEDPKFRQINNQGICSLEIRKPGSFDGGVYACRAKNAHGEVTIQCKLEVKQPVIAEADQKKK